LKTFRKFYEIDWPLCEEAVYRIQCDIAKAWMAGHHAHAAQLQDTLVRTFEARALAVKKVWTNPGSKTPGLDGVVWQNDADLMEAVGTLRDLSAYTPMPVKRVYIPKARGGRRPLGIPTLYDRAVQTIFTLALMPIAECEADRRSYGYRPYKSAHDAATYLKLVLGAKYAKRWVLEADIEMFFDSLSHEWLLQNIPMNPKVLKKFLKAGFMELPHPEVHETPGGTPQGGAISPVLANMALNGLEQALGDAFRVVRFADDFVVIGASKEALHDRALPVVRAFLQPRGLTLAAAKTAITPIERGFDFLGLTFREYKDDARAVGYKQGIFLVTPSKASVLAFKKRLKQAIKSLHKHSARAVIIKVNPMLRGWAQYYKPFTSKKVFSALGHYVWTLLWRWCRKKHPTMPLRVLRSKYFKREGGNHWVFYARDSKHRTITLVQLGWIKIVRHTLCADLNPFRPGNIEYYRRRRKRGATPRASLNANQTNLLKKQRGTCPVCHGDLLNGEPLEVHHIHPRNAGGKDTLRNLLVLHAFCHKQITYAKSPALKAAWVKAGIVKDLGPSRRPSGGSPGSK